jgi:DNA polymerase III sliding clamp (beta) subunit (PCNA family)
VSLPNHSVIVPRKGVIELMRMLDGGETPLNKEALHLAGHHYPGHTELLAHLTTQFNSYKTMS